MNLNGLMFQAVANMNFMFQFAAVNVLIFKFFLKFNIFQSFCEELPIFIREHQAHLYSVGTYFLAKNLAELVQYIFYPIVFSTIVYWMAGNFFRNIK